MYRCSKERRNKEGKIIKPAAYQSHVNSGTRARLEPSRAWFSNTKVIGQSALQKFQEEMAKASKDPYQVVMRKTHLPVTLLNETGRILLIFHVPLMFDINVLIDLNHYLI